MGPVLTCNTSAAFQFCAQYLGEDRAEWQKIPEWALNFTDSIALARDPFLTGACFAKPKFTCIYEPATIVVSDSQASELVNLKLILGNKIENTGARIHNHDNSILYPFDSVVPSKFYCEFTRA